MQKMNGRALLQVEQRTDVNSYNDAATTNVGEILGTQGKAQQDWICNTSFRLMLIIMYALHFHLCMAPIHSRNPSILTHLLLKQTDIYDEQPFHHD